MPPAAPHPNLFLGTCAWSFDHWRGTFYPDHLPQSERLAFYARHFNAVEVDSTFYHPPSPHTAHSWLERTPDHFRFACKLPRLITHELRLRDAAQPLARFLEDLEPLRPKLAPLLVQLPASFTPPYDEHALRDFARHLPTDHRWAIEFRHPGWNTPRIARLLEELGICWTWTDTSPIDRQGEAPFDLAPDSAPFLYIRLLGDLSTKYRADGSLAHTYGSLLWPRDTAVEEWAEKIRLHLRTPRDAYIFINNHFEGFSPLSCQRLGTRLGIPITLPSPTHPPHPNDIQLDLL